jgi:hypothetical protein
MRWLLLLLLLLGAGPAQAVTFGFDLFPDSAGCFGPTPVGAGPFANCDPDRADDWHGGVVTSRQHTRDGLSLTLRTTNPFHEEGVDWGFLVGVINCGNEEDCPPFLADSSIGLEAVSVDLVDLVDLATPAAAATSRWR